MKVFVLIRVLINLNLEFHKMLLLTIFTILFEISASSLLKSQIVSQLTFQGFPVNHFYGYIQPIIDFQYNTKIGYLNIHMDCFSIHRTNSLLYVGCELPRKCGIAHTYIFDSTVFGQETVLCYSLSNNYDDDVEVYDFSFVPHDVTLLKPFDRSNIKQLKQLKPVDFSEHYFLVSNSTHFSLYPRICDILFSFSSSVMTSLIHLRNNAKSVCLEIIRPPLNCSLFWFDSVFELLKYYDFPVSFAGATPNPYYESTLNTYFNTSDYIISNNFHVAISFKDGNYFFSHPDDILISYHINYPFKSAYRHCLEIKTAYSNPFSGIFHFLLSKLEYFFREVISILLLIVKDISSFLFKLIFAIFDEFLTIIPLSNHLLTSLLCFVIFRSYYRDYFLSIVFSILIFIFLNLNLNFSLKQQNEHTSITPI